MIKIKINEISDDFRQLALLRNRFRKALRMSSNPRIKGAYQKYGDDFLNAVIDSMDLNGDLTDQLMTNKYVGRKTFNAVKNLLMNLKSIKESI